MDRVSVQIDNNGQWMTVAVCPNEPQFYRIAMRNAQQQHPDRRIRVIDQAGRLLDLA